MRSSAIIASCALLIAALLSPGVAAAKGGNGQHSGATTKASDAKKPSATKDKAKPPIAVKKSKKSVKPKVTSPRAVTKAKGAKKPSREAPKTAAKKKSDKAKEPKPEIAAQTEGTAPTAEEVPASPPSVNLAEQPFSSDTIGEGDIATRGVLDTIRVKLNTSLEGVRAAVAAMWSTLTA